jgi:hypothetical protein
VTEFIEGGQPEVADHLDDSAVVPGPKAHVPPLDELRFQIGLGPDGFSVNGGATVQRGLEAPVTVAVLAGTAVIVAWAAAELSLRCALPGWLALAFGTVCGASVLAVGIVIWSKQKHIGARNS